MLNLMILAAVFLAVSLAAWTGIWRSWADNRFVASAFLHAVPGGAIFLLSVALGSLLPRPLELLVVALGVLCGLTGLALAATASDRLLPAWYRERVRARGVN